MPNPLGKNERGFFGNKGGAPGQCGSTPLPEKKEKKKEDSHVLEDEYYDLDGF